MPAGNHTVVLTALFERNAGEPGYYFYFDYLWPLVPQDVPDPQKEYPDVSLAIDFDTDHGYKKPPAWHLWHLQKLGFKGHADVYMGVFWNNKRRRVGATYPYATIEYRLADGIAAPLAGDVVLIQVSGSLDAAHRPGGRVLAGYRQRDARADQPVLRRVGRQQLRDQHDPPHPVQGSVLGVPRRLDHRRWHATLGGYVNEPFAITAGVNDALQFTFGGEGRQVVNVTLTAGAARTGAEVCAQIFRRRSTAAGAPATAEPVSFGANLDRVTDRTSTVDGTACDALGCTALVAAPS